MTQTHTHKKPTHDQEQNFLQLATRKPEYCAEIHSTGSSEGILQELAMALPHYTGAEVYGRTAFRPSESFVPGLELPQWFLLKTATEDYIVNTEGYSYARYILRVVYAAPTGGHTEPEETCELCRPKGGER